MINEQSINRCWEEAMKYFLKYSYSTDLCGREYLVLDNLVVEAKDYLCEAKASEYCLCSSESIEYYLGQIDNPGKFSEIGRLYSYGSYKINQYDYAIKVLKKRKNVKPIVLPIYDPGKDNRANVATPCMNSIVLEHNKGILNMQVNYSTMNLFRMGLLDFYQVAHLHRRFADDADKQVGNLRIDIIKIHMPIFDYLVSQYIFGIGELYE